MLSQANYWSTEVLNLECEYGMVGSSTTDDLRTRTTAFMSTAPGSRALLGRRVRVLAATFFGHDSLDLPAHCS